ncbi:MAG: tRNA (adenosine(37)-N6)-dimethylallyltransferase MiaA [Candidatus Binatia bacterium]
MTAVSSLRSRAVVICGPTAVGKTDLAVELAGRMGAEVISADSRQVYRRMDIGTGKPSTEQLALVRHHLIDLVDPDQTYDVAAWLRAALDTMRDLQRRATPPLVCGGTGLYLSALARGLVGAPPADETIRGRLLAAEKAEPGSLYDRLERLDPESAARIHPNDRVRVVRALEVLESTGSTISALREAQAGGGPAFELLMLELKLPRAELYSRIDDRVGRMLEAGFLDEVRALEKQGYHRGLRAFNAIGYPQAWDCLEGRLRESELGEEIAGATRNYAKRQLTWFRGQFHCRSLAAGDSDEAYELAMRFFY